MPLCACCAYSQTCGWLCSCSGCLSSGFSASLRVIPQTSNGRPIASTVFAILHHPALNRSSEAGLGVSDSGAGFAICDPCPTSAGPVAASHRQARPCPQRIPPTRASRKACAHHSAPSRHPRDRVTCRASSPAPWLQRLLGPS